MGSPGPVRTQDEHGRDGGSRQEHGGAGPSHHPLLSSVGTSRNLPRLASKRRRVRRRMRPARPSGQSESTQAMYERFTDRARKVMQLANQEAQRFNHEYIGTEHILLGLVKEGSGVAANVLKNLDIDLRKIRLEVEKIVQAGPDMVTMGKLPQTPAGQEGHRVLDRGGPQPQPQLRRHRTPAARPAARAGGRGRPGAHEPRASSSKTSARKS